MGCYYDPVPEQSVTFRLNHCVCTVIAVDLQPCDFRECGSAVHCQCIKSQLNFALQVWIFQSMSMRIHRPAMPCQSMITVSSTSCMIIVRGPKNLVKAPLSMYSFPCGCRQASGGFKGSNREGLVLSMNTTKLILRQVIAAIQGLHRTHTLHADVKPDNFLVSPAACLIAMSAECACTAVTFAEYEWPIWVSQ